MINRLRSGNKPKSHDQMPTCGKVPPTKEDILSTMDQFGDMDTDDSSPEVVNGDNNNTKRLASKDNLDTGSWDFGEVEPLGVSSLSNAYGMEWDKLFTKPNYRRLLRALAMTGNLRSSRFRSICWKVFLEVIPEDMGRWIPKIREWRAKYDDLKRKLIINPRKAVDHSVSDLVVNNPLSQADESPWNQFFLDNELRLTIKQDVIRTFPEIQFFQNPELQEQMIDLLFCYSRAHSSILYKQGMHELLAPLIFVLHCDHQAFLHANEVESLGEIVKELMDPTYLEHDAYAMLCQIMDTVEPWYNSKDILVPKTKEKVTVTLFSRAQDTNSSIAIVSKLTRVHDYILKKFDPELHLHLERLDIAPQIYGIRWVRLLFGREFPMQDLLVLWDALFADGIGFDLVDYVFASMLLYIRDLLLASDYPQCLNCLMRFPPVADVHYLIEKARYLREPNNYPRPPNYTVQTVNQLVTNKPQKPVSRANEQPATNKGRAAGTLSTSFSSFTRKMGSRPKTLSMSQSQKMYKSSSVPMNLETDISPEKWNTVPASIQTMLSETASPQYPQKKRGSSASLSQVEDSVFRSTPSAASLARMDTRNRSMDNSPMAYTPDDGDSANGGVSQFATLPRARKKGKKSAKQEQDEYENQVGELHSQLSKKEAMCNYCASKLDVHISRLQHELQQQDTLQGEDEILLAIAGIKQVRDVLKGTLKFSQALIEEDNVEITENHYMEEPSSTSPESDPEKKSSDAKHQGARKGSKGKMFYMSSEENSEAADSPTDGSGNRFINKDVELSDYRIGRGKSNTFTEGNRTNCVETRSGRSASMPYRSPNPLYKGESSEDDCVS
ncbi:TBC1 domain family member 5-like isoform X2 [Mizuhopecten yessoensis]|uniref:TBC1 domain family member 5-like isoform X2 n=1 Tax=Mizuhopecten yessoensis TaxID=6573 RepID=UPI000B45B598|nr:TBC1 domain family member 5-like isoform X2 [Mizuhopecten yessoensis]